MPTLRASCLFAGLLASCSSPQPGPPAPAAPDRVLVVGAQVWNGRSSELHCDVRAVNAEGETILLAARLLVPASRAAADASLGDDPNRVREVTGRLPPGSWMLEVEDERGIVGRCALQWPTGNWGIAFAGPDRIQVLVDSGPRRLE